MRATLERLATGRTASGGMPRLLGTLVLVGVLVAGCSGQGGSSKGPTHPAQQTGAPDAAVLLTLNIQEGPGGAQFTITVLVESIGGRPLQGSTVTLLTTGGRLDPNRGSTDATGVFRSILTCDDDGAASVVTASAEGVIVTDTACGAPAPAPGPVAGGTPPVTP
jgi:hypothetical protein